MGKMLAVTLLVSERRLVLALVSSLLFPSVVGLWNSHLVGDSNWSSQGVEHREFGLCPPPLDQREAATLDKCPCSADLNLPSDAVLHGLAWRS